jgi:hypothetical protein
LADYSLNEYRKEQRLLVQVVDAGVARAIDGTEELAICKKEQVRMLHEDYFVDPGIAVDVVETLTLILDKKEPLRCRD